MSESEASETTRGGGGATLLPFPTPAPNRTSFNREELRLILNVYGRGVAGGEWRDYAIDFSPDRAVFSIYRRASEMPLYRIVKDRRLAAKQGAYALVTATGLVLKRGHDLARVLAAVEAPLKLVPA